MPLRRLSSFFFVRLLKLGILSTLFSGRAQAFLAYDWPDDPDHTGGVSHETITRIAFNNMVETYWPGQKITHDMFMARATMITANTRVDDDQFHTARHFDAENFDGGQYVLTGTPVGVKETANPEDVDLLHQILWGLETYSVVDAQVALGKALHCIRFKTFILTVITLKWATMTRILVSEESTSLSNTPRTSSIRVRLALQRRRTRNATTAIIISSCRI